MKPSFFPAALPLLFILSAMSSTSTAASPEKERLAPEARISVVDPAAADAAEVFAAGPDLVVGDLSGLAQFGSAGTQVGLSMAPTSCNGGDVPVDFFMMPNPDHSVIVQNLYRMSGGTTNTDRFEQVGQSWVKHTFGADQFNTCSYGCTPAPDQTTLGVGCSDAYDASQGASQNGGLGSRAWVNPFTGAFPSTAAQHTGHVHTGTSHRLVAETSDLNPAMNAGATYYAEVQYITPQEYTWCQAHPGQCNMFNNVSYRRFTPSGTTSFSFAALGVATRMKSAIMAWTDAVLTMFEPAPTADGRGTLGYKASGPVNGVWHYEYAIYNENLDRAVQSFTVPLGCGITVSNTGFHAPQNPPGFSNDGTLANAGYSNAAWTLSQTGSALSWSTETFAQNQNANAIRWGTLYNFRFDSNRPPQAVNATIGFFKTGAPIVISVQGPAPDTCTPLQMVSAVSRKTHGTAGDFDIDLPLNGEPGVECRDSGGSHTVVATFSNSLASGQASVTSGSGAVVGSPGFSGNTMRIQLSGVGDQQKLTLLLSNVTDSFNQVMPDTSVSMNVLIGDTNGSKAVNATDIGQVKAAAGAPVTAANFRADINANGAVTASDIAQVKSATGGSVP